MTTGITWKEKNPMSDNEEKTQAEINAKKKKERLNLPDMKLN